MLKTFRGLILGLVVLVGSAYVTPTYASSAYIKMIEVQPGSVDSPLDEMVVLYNNLNFSLEVTDWCLVNKADVVFVCLGEEDSEVEVHMPPYSYAVIVSESLAQKMPEGSYVASYVPTNASWGSIVASSDTLLLIDDSGDLIDDYSWSSGISSQHIWRRTRVGAPPNYFYLDTNLPIDWQAVTRTHTEVNNAIVVGEPYPEEEPAEEAVDEELPQEPVLPPLDIHIEALRISEVFPNPKGSDAGVEYIELYNGGAETLDLGAYELRIGKQLEKTHALPGELLEPGQYRLYTHADFNFTLLNTNSRVALYYADTLLDQTEYIDPKDDMAWANINATWQYTNMPTPGRQNSASIAPVETSKPSTSTTSSSLKPCASNQYRHPETNRCRLIATATTPLTPCKEGQERNPETNRCRSVVAKTSVPAPCKEGQERNPETNRCRNIVSMTDAPHAVLGVEEEVQSQSSWYLWAVAGMVVFGALTYAAWEWRVEVRRLLVRLKERFVQAKK